MADDQELESGYGPRAPTGDNLCNDFQRETARSYVALAQTRGDANERIEGVVSMSDAASPLPFWNRAVLEQPITAADQIVPALRAFYADRSPHPFLFDSAWPTPDLREHGFTLMGHPPLMVRAAHAPLPQPPPELRIVPVKDAAGARDLEQTLIDGYPAPQLQPFTHITMFTPATFDAPGWHHFVGYVDDRPVAAGSCSVGERLLRVENIATLGDVRGRGYGLAITAATIGVDPAKPAALVASDLGRPIYEKLGFAAMLRVTYWLGLRS
jgi:hypothetical protein